ncbi:alpha/beta hydrolase family protein [Leptospira interrogans serovar Valbuzzi str. Duyster]|uniref:lipase family alpha/beta hydrolase n=1 Tax=Leptospira interrogans TaxID=173 RepID=UPI0002BACE25|nr:alpha/beta fold hydrolase [Leptospira interrogans]EMJ57934.1 alpha/beta hydrolase family protein [Leptospira interrogans serovar Valbuzzi str. Duyster]ENO74257.1 alpha/beta hydrolase family protein [Leptospira interrogans serovar Valbuzzi str. Valbuzzi]
MKKMNLKILLTLVFLITNVTYASGGGTSSKPLSGSYPIVLAHGLFGWRNGSTVVDYWGGNAAYLRNQGAYVLTPSVTALNSSSSRASQLKTSILAAMAANNYTGKVHIIGHSQGGLDARYMVSNLSMSTKVATLTTLNTPHQGSPIANIVAAVIPNWALPYVSTVLNTIIGFVYGDSSQNAISALKLLTTDGLKTFNSATPNVSGVKYFSYGSTISVPDLIQHPAMGILHPICAIGAPFYGMSIANDGVVPDSSQRWGTWKGGPSIPILTTGIDHLEATNALYLGQLWYDTNAYFLKMVNNAKSNQ